jgi:hypothetical protein
MSKWGNKIENLRLWFWNCMKRVKKGLKLDFYKHTNQLPVLKNQAIS